MSIVMFMLALFFGFVCGRVSVKHEPPDLSNAELKLKEELVVAQNLNESLFQDLQEAKEALWKMKQEKQNGNQKTSSRKNSSKENQI